MHEVVQSYLHAYVYVRTHKYNYIKWLFQPAKLGLGWMRRSGKANAVYWNSPIKWSSFKAKAT